MFNNGHFAVCVDFAHNGYSTRNHLEALREYHPKRIVCVFGADGNRSKYRRYEMGEASALLADLSIVTAGHNRYETFDQIFADIKIGIDKAQKEKAEPVSYLVIPNRKEAIRYAIEHAQEGKVRTGINVLGKYCGIICSNSNSGSNCSSCWRNHGIDCDCKSEKTK